ncbi:hypothetical protein KM043_008758 [Ampulex compressa]|nr:hypothetical protein KM043_008758 [Ampulex compressa]
MRYTRAESPTGLKTTRHPSSRQMCSTVRDKTRDEDSSASFVKPFSTRSVDGRPRRRAVFESGKTAGERLLLLHRHSSSGPRHYSRGIRVAKDIPQSPTPPGEPSGRIAREVPAESASRTPANPPEDAPRTLHGARRLGLELRKCRGPRRNGTSEDAWTVDRKRRENPTRRSRTKELVRSRTRRKVEKRSVGPLGRQSRDRPGGAVAPGRANETRSPRARIGIDEYARRRTFAAAPPRSEGGAGEGGAVVVEARARDGCGAAGVAGPSSNNAKRNTWAQSARREDKRITGALCQRCRLLSSVDLANRVGDAGAQDATDGRGPIFKISRLVEARLARPRTRIR